MNASDMSRAKNRHLQRDDVAARRHDRFVMRRRLEHQMIWFAVKLLKVPPVSELSSWDVFELMVNARHVSGDYWIFEGDVETLDVSGAIEVVSEGVTEGTGGMGESDLKTHCEEIFGVELDGTDPAWKMLSDNRMYRSA